MGHIACIGRNINAQKVSVRKPEGKQQLVRSRRRWQNTIKIGLEEIGSL